MGLFSGLFGTSLPNVGPENPPATGKHDVSASVVSQKLNATTFINFTVNGSTNHIHIIRDVLVNFVKHTLANFDAVNNIYFADVLESQHTDVILLSSRGWVKSRLIQND